MTATGSVLALNQPHVQFKGSLVTLPDGILLQVHAGDTLALGTGLAATLMRHTRND